VPDVRENTRALRQNVCRFLEISFRPFITFFRAVTKSIFYRRWENVWPLAWSHVKYEKPRRRLIFKEYAVFSYTQKNIHSKIYHSIAKKSDYAVYFFPFKKSIIFNKENFLDNNFKIYLLRIFQKLKYYYNAWNKNLFSFEEHHKIDRKSDFFI